jgi:hypothetical protein
MCAFCFVLSLKFITLELISFFKFLSYSYINMRGLSSTINDTGGGCGSDVDHLQGNEAEDHFEPSLFNEYSPLPLSEDVHTAFLATNLLLLYLNLARLSTMSIGDTHQLPVTVNDREDRDDDDNK